MKLKRGNKKNEEAHDKKESKMNEEKGVERKQYELRATWWKITRRM